MRSWPDVDDRALWHLLVDQPVPDDPIEFAAVYLFLQARQAHHAPLWVRGPGWVSKGNGSSGQASPCHTKIADWRVGGGNGGTSQPGHTHDNEHLRASRTRAGRRRGQQTEPSHRSYGDQDLVAPSHRPLRVWTRAGWTGAETEPAHQREPRSAEQAREIDGSAPVQRVQASARWGGALSRASLLARVMALRAFPWTRLQVLDDYREAIGEARAGDVSYEDPPYLHASVRYAAGFPADLEERSLEAADRGVSVVVSEGRPMPQLVRAGFAAEDVTIWFRGNRPPGSEWITHNMNRKG